MRNRKKMTKAKLAIHFGIARGTLYTWENEGFPSGGTWEQQVQWIEHHKWESMRRYQRLCYLREMAKQTPKKARR